MVVAKGDVLHCSDLVLASAYSEISGLSTMAMPDLVVKFGEAARKHAPLCETHFLPGVTAAMVLTDLKIPEQGQIPPAECQRLFNKFRDIIARTTRNIILPVLASKIDARNGMPDSGKNDFDIHNESRRELWDLEEKGRIKRQVNMVKFPEVRPYDRETKWQPRCFLIGTILGPHGVDPQEWLSQDMTDGPQQLSSRNIVESPQGRKAVKHQQQTSIDDERKEGRVSSIVEVLGKFLGQDDKAKTNDSDFRTVVGQSANRALVETCTEQMLILKELMDLEEEGSAEKLEFKQEYKALLLKKRGLLDAQEIEISQKRDEEISRKRQAPPHTSDGSGSFQSTEKNQEYSRFQAGVLEKNVLASRLESSRTPANFRSPDTGGAREFQDGQDSSDNEVSIHIFFLLRAIYFYESI